MIQKYGDMLSEANISYYDIICITTNGFVKSNGQAVMGRGCAAQINKMTNNKASKLLANEITRYGHEFQFFMSLRKQVTGLKCMIYSFPVKPEFIKTDNIQQNVVKHMQNKFNPGDTIPGWAATADIRIIKRSLYQLQEFSSKKPQYKIAMPRPGCGAGELIWDQIYQLIKEEFPDIYHSPNIHFWTFK